MLVEHQATLPLVYGYALETLVETWPEQEAAWSRARSELASRDTTYELVHALRGLHRVGADKYHDTLVAALERQLFSHNPWRGGIWSRC